MSRVSGREDPGPAGRQARRGNPAARRAVLVVLGLAGGGCGYSLGYRAPPLVARIAVPIFDNQTFPLRREVEIELTRAFREEIQSRTGLILTTEEDADMVVYGTVSDFEERVVAEGPRDEKIESSIVIETVLLVEDYRNQRQWKERVRVAEPLSVEIGESIETARRRAVGNLANRMLEVIESWDAGGEAAAREP